MKLDEIAEEVRNIVFELRHIKNEMIRHANDPEYMRRLAKRIEGLL